MDSQNRFQKILDMASSKLVHGGEPSDQSTEVRSTTRLILLFYLFLGDLSIGFGH
jgi:hypothetical protein